MTAGAAMGFSSVSVVTNSLTLKWWRRPTGSLMPGVPPLVEDVSIRGRARALAEDAWESVRTLLSFGKSRAPSRREYDQVPMEAI
jgi:P-type Cu+ transporter